MTFSAFGGRVLVYTSLRDAPFGADIWMRTDLGPSSRTQALIEREGAQTQGHQILASAAKRLFAVPHVIPEWGGDARWLAFAFCRSRRAAAAVQHRAGPATHRPQGLLSSGAVKEALVSQLFMARSMAEYLGRFAQLVDVHLRASRYGGQPSMTLA
jgi:hypothetical protein